MKEVKITLQTLVQALLQVLLHQKISCKLTVFSFNMDKDDDHVVLVRMNYIYPPIGPGPGRYKLPHCCGHQMHDPTKKTMPAYSFGKRLENLSK